MEENYLKKIYWILVIISILLLILSHILWEILIILRKGCYIIGWGTGSLGLLP